MRTALRAGCALVFVRERPSGYREVQFRKRAARRNPVGILRCRRIGQPREATALMKSECERRSKVVKAGKAKAE